MLYVWKNGESESFVGGSKNPPIAEIKEKVGDDFDYITEHFFFEPHPHRAMGIYRLGTATGELDKKYQGEGRYLLFLNLKFKKFEDAQELYRRVRTGTIRPVVSFEEPQVPAEPNETVIRFVHTYPTIRSMVKEWARRFRASVSYWWQRYRW